MAFIYTGGMLGDICNVTKLDLVVLRDRERAERTIIISLKLGYFEKILSPKYKVGKC